MIKLVVLKGGFTVVAKKGQGKWTGAECRDRVELGVCCLCCLGVCLYVWGVRGFGTKETITARPGAKAVRADAGSRSG